MKITLKLIEIRKYMSIHKRLIVIGVFSFKENDNQTIRFEIKELEFEIGKEYEFELKK